MNEINFPLWLVQSRSIPARQKIILAVLLTLSFKVNSSFFRVSEGYLSRFTNRTGTVIRRCMAQLKRRYMIDYKLTDEGVYTVYLDINHISRID